MKTTTVNNNTTTLFWNTAKVKEMVNEATKLQDQAKTVEQFINNETNGNVVTELQLSYEHLMNAWVSKLNAIRNNEVSAPVSTISDSERIKLSIPDTEDDNLMGSSCDINIINLDEENKLNQLVEECLAFTKNTETNTSFQIANKLEETIKLIKNTNTYGEPIASELKYGQYEIALLETYVNFHTNCEHSKYSSQYHAAQYIVQRIDTFTKYYKLNVNTDVEEMTDEEEKLVIEMSELHIMLSNEAEYFKITNKISKDLKKFADLIGVKTN